MRGCDSMASGRMQKKDKNQGTCTTWVGQCVARVSGGQAGQAHGTNATTGTARGLGRTSAEARVGRNKRRWMHRPPTPCKANLRHPLHTLSLSLPVSHYLIFRLLHHSCSLLCLYTTHPCLRQSTEPLARLPAKVKIAEAGPRPIR